MFDNYGLVGLNGRPEKARKQAGCNVHELGWWQFAGYMQEFAVREERARRLSRLRTALDRWI